VNIRKSVESDKPSIRELHLNAFGEAEGPEIANLVDNMFNDPTGFPMLSLVAEEDNVIVGHILYTNVNVVPDGGELEARLLAPMAVDPDYQNKGIGGQLIKDGFNWLKDSGVDIVFVLGHPRYYPRFGFVPAGENGFEAPYPILEKNAGAWMLYEIYCGVSDRFSGTVKCSNALDRPELWQE
jgi:predicted N-acetyltransferase YhbS